MPPSNDSAPDRPQVRAALSVDGGRSFEGTLEEMGPRTVGIAVPGSGAATAELGARAEIVLTSDALEREHRGRGHVIAWYQEGNVAHCTLRYSDPDDYRRLVDTGLGRHFNRRGAFRVEPAAANPVAVVVEDASGRRLAGHAKDVSATGMALVLDAGPGVELTSGQALSLHVTLPWLPSPLLVGARVCYCGERDGEMRYGVDFVAGSTADFEQTQDHVVDYVMKRQREILRDVPV